MSSQICIQIKKKLLTENEFWKDYTLGTSSQRDTLPYKRDPNAKIDLW